MHKFRHVAQTTSPRLLRHGAFWTNPAVLSAVHVQEAPSLHHLSRQWKMAENIYLKLLVYRFSKHEDDLNGKLLWIEDRYKNQYCPTLSPHALVLTCFILHSLFGLQSDVAETARSIHVHSSGNR